MYERIRRMIDEKADAVIASKRSEEFTDGYLTAMEDLEDILDAVDWIPVSDGNPTEPGLYWITGKKKYSPPGELFMNFGAYYSGGWTCTGGLEVIAWMDMPEPYRRKEASR